MERFHPPGHLDDFDRRPHQQEALARGWDAVVHAWMDIFTGVEGGAFYNPHADDTPGEPDRASIAWDAFPRPLSKWFEGEDAFDTKRWRAAEVLRPRRFGGQPLRQVVEGALGDPVTVLHRQQDEHVDPSIAIEDLVWPYDVAGYDDQEQQWAYFGRGGSYNPFNRWNTTHGAMHLTHPANTLVGEFRVAARAAVLRPVDDAEALVACSGFGEPNRASDPSIGWAVNGLVRQGYSVSLANPVGLYMAGINLGAFRGPGGEAIDGAWRVDRGDAERQMILRATFSAPEGAPYSVGEMRTGGEPITTGGQIADQVQMILTGLAKRRGYQGEEQPCVAVACEHPDKPGVTAVVNPCATVDWDDRAPLTDDAPPPAAPRSVVAQRSWLATPAGHAR